jgi:hypothetical protein
MDSSLSPQLQRRQMGMSYKFQRLREKIRQAVSSGELSGKLPGERELARRFNVNAKTLSKALTDLAAEGLLHRSIGRGTFVRSDVPQESRGEGPWLLLVDGDDNQELVKSLQAINPQCQIAQDVASLRPSFLNQFTAVIDMASATPEPFLRDLLVRNVSVIAVGREPRTYSTNAVLPDLSLGASHIARQLLLDGHRRFAAIEARNQTSVSDAIRRMAGSYGSEVSVDSCFPRDIASAVESGVTACICDSITAAEETIELLNQSEIAVPQRVSVAAIGCTADQIPCSGYYVSAEQRAAAVAELLHHGQSGRPTTLWLTGQLIDRGTTTQPQIVPEGLPAGLPRVSALSA